MFPSTKFTACLCRQWRTAALGACLLVVLLAGPAGARETEGAHSPARSGDAADDLGQRNDTTGNPRLDWLLSQELGLLSRGFMVRPGFFVIREESGPNAHATDRVYDPSFPDGSVLFGLELMSQEFQESSSREGFAIPAIMAHEFAHILQYKVGTDWHTGKHQELHADFLAGWYMANRARWIQTDGFEAARSFYRKGDYAFNHPEHHGTPQERYEAVLAGAQHGSLKVLEAYDAGLGHVLGSP